jgi:hypothetical protein
MYRKTKDVTNNCSGKCTEKPKMLRKTVVENVQKNQRCYEQLKWKMYRKTKDVTNNCSGKCTEKPKMLRTTVVEN